MSVALLADIRRRLDEAAARADRQLKVLERMERRAAQYFPLTTRGKRPVR